MSATVKITELPAITVVNANTANTVLVGVDIETDVTGKITLTTLAAGLYSNNNLYVGNNDIILSNAVAQFTGNSAVYLQASLRNQDGDGSGDYVLTADDGNDSNYFLDLGLNGSTYSDPDYSSMEAHDGYLYVKGSGAEGNLVIGTATNSRIKFIVGGTESDNVVAYMTGSGIFSPSINSLVASNVATLRGEITANATSANSVINTRVSANVATLRGEISSNAASTNAFANLAFTKANNAIANTNGVLTAGDFYISGDGFVNGTFTLANSNFGATESAMTIKATATTQTPSNDGYMLHISGKANTPSRIVFDSFSTNGSAYGLVAGRTARGTVTSPTATQNNDVMMRLSGNGWGTTGFAPLGVARIDIVATENYTDSARGSKIVFYNIANGSNTVQEIASFNAETVQFDGTVQPSKGFIYVPTILAGSQTAFTIDFSTTSLIKCNIAADCGITLSNYAQGKVVEVWITNTSGSNRTVTHGCSALNSTVNSTTVTIPATSSGYLRYFSIGTDNANTFVAIQSA